MSSPPGEDQTSLVGADSEGVLNRLAASVGSDGGAKHEDTEPFRDAGRSAELRHAVHRRP